MAWIIFLLGSAGFLFCTAFPVTANRALANTKAGATEFYRRAKERFRSAPGVDENLPLIGSLIASTRAGLSLDTALHSLQKDIAIPAATRRRMQYILEGKPPRDFLSTFLSEALTTGIPVLAPLRAFQKALQAERKVRLKAKSLTGQSRAQAEVFSWLPWVMVAILLAIDQDWFYRALFHRGSWFCWAIALALLGFGRQWMHGLLGRALRPTGDEEKMQEEFLPELTLRLLAQLSLGRDAESSLELCLANSTSAPHFVPRFRDPSTRGEAGGALWALLDHANRTGAPLRDDLTSFLADLHLQAESRWEERAQKLPVTMLGPLFLCFFPSGLLVLLALVLPLLPDLP